ncbi:HIRAN domain-containing protein [Schlesneria sp. DSM 10557]|uniref:HIRAN domain-containing protein n=1 Tax=Schlesneria sp. DSM 10557 TaxID=3044399 RepID=UPI0035C7D031
MPLTTVSRWVKVGEERHRVAGVTHDQRQDSVRRSRPGTAAHLHREPSNRFDPNAVAIFVNRKQVGYLQAETAARLAPRMDAGTVRFEAKVADVWSFESDDADEIWMMDLMLSRFEKRSVEVVHYSRMAQLTFQAAVDGVRSKILPTLKNAVVGTSRATDRVFQKFTGGDITLLWIMRGVAVVLLVGMIAAVVDALV